MANSDNVNKKRRPTRVTNGKSSSRTYSADERPKLARDTDKNSKQTRPSKNPIMINHSGKLPRFHDSKNKTNEKEKKFIKKISFPFEMYGNMDGVNVEYEHGGNCKGDGSIGSCTIYVKVYASHKIKLDSSTGKLYVTVHIKYDICEENYETSNDRDHLWISKTFSEEYDLGIHDSIKNNSDGSKSIVNVTCENLNNENVPIIYYGKFKAENYTKGDFLYLDKNQKALDCRYPKKENENSSLERINLYCDWLDRDDFRIRFDVDSKENEYNGLGNIAIIGKMNFYVSVNVESYTEYDESKVQSKILLDKRKIFKLNSINEKINTKNIVVKDNQDEVDVKDKDTKNEVDVKDKDTKDEVDVKDEDMKNENVKDEDTKNEDVKNEDTKNDDVKNKDDVKSEDTKDEDEYNYSKLINSDRAIVVVGNVRFDGKENISEEKDGKKKDEDKKDNENNKFINEDGTIILKGNVSSVLGCGYDICGEYARMNSIRMPVLDINQLNKDHKIIRQDMGGAMDLDSIVSESAQDYSSKIESKLNVKVSASACGASFSSENTTTSTKDTSISSRRRFISFSRYYRTNKYLITSRPESRYFIKFLGDDFLDALNNSTPEEIVNNFGTHVLFGLITGARFTYNLSYIKSSSEITKAKTFSSIDSIKFSETSGVVKDKVIPQKKQSVEEIVTEEIRNGKLSDAKYKSALEYLAQIQTNSSKDKKAPNSENKSSSTSATSGGSNGKFGFSISPNYSTTSTETNKFEEESTRVNCYAIGGNVESEYSMTPENYEEWWKSIKENSQNWCDFAPNTLIPIYELVPLGYKISAEDLHVAWTNYIKQHNVNYAKMGEDVIYQSIYVKGSSDVRVLRCNESDREISSSKNKLTGWKLYLELVNIENGDVALAVQLLVGEDGLNSGRSLLQLNEIVDLGRSVRGDSMIDTTKVNPVYTVFGEIYRQVVNEYLDITRFVRDCPFLDLSDGKRVYIMLDGKDDNDSKYIRFKAHVKVPVIYDCQDNYGE